MMMNPEMIEMLMLSAGAPPAIIQVIKLLQAEGIAGFVFKRIPEESALHPFFPPRVAGAERTAVGFAMEGPTSRISGVVFLEGVSDELLAKIDAQCPAVALPSRA